MPYICICIFLFIDLEATSVKKSLNSILSCNKKISCYENDTLNESPFHFVPINHESMKRLHFPSTELMCSPTHNKTYSLDVAKGGGKDAAGHFAKNYISKDVKVRKHLAKVS